MLAFAANHIKQNWPFWQVEQPTLVDPLSTVAGPWSDLVETHHSSSA